VVCLLVVLAAYRLRLPLRRRWGLAALALLAMAAYVGILAIGRPLDYILWCCSYGMYVFCACGVLFCYNLIDFDAVSHVQRRALVVGLLVLIVGNAYADWKLSWSVHERNAAICDYFAALDQFVHDHRHETDFSFSLAPGPEWNRPVVCMMAGHPEEAGAEEFWLPIAALLYPQYYAAADARHHFHYPAPAD
jgi:hypothetical protein